MPARTRLFAGALAVIVAIIGVAPAARADSVANKRREAQQIADEIDRLGERAAELGEAWNGAQLKLQQAQADVQQAQAKLADLESKLGKVRTTAGDFALKAYMYADQTSGVASLVSGASITDGSAQRAGYEIVALGNAAQVTDDMKVLIEDEQTEQAVLDAREKQQAQYAKDVAAAQSAAEAAQAQQQDALTKVKGELVVLVRQEQQRRREEAARQDQIAAQQARATLLAAQTAPQPLTQSRSSSAQAFTGPTSTTTTSPSHSDNGNSASNGNGASTDNGNGDGGSSTQTSAAPAPPTVDVPPTSPGAAIAVRAALSQLGVPYRFAAASPGVAFDCSGLTMWAWGQAGVSLPHFAAAQYAMLPHVPLDQLQPGDLVFFYRDLGHVGIYLGNGQFIHAPHTGDVVKISPLSGRNLVGAARP
jgi:cell wall-associated NlpC family hydrolase